MTSIIKTVSEKLAEYSSRQFVQEFDRIEVEPQLTNDFAITVTEVLQQHFPGFDEAVFREEATGEQLAIGIETADGDRVGCLARGVWLVIVVITICLTLGLLAFGPETVFKVLEIIASIYKGEFS